MANEFISIQMADSRFVDVDLSRTEFRDCLFADTRMIGVVVENAQIDGEIESLVVNDVEVSGYVNAELDRRYPIRLSLRSRDLDELRDVWPRLVADWERTEDRIAELTTDQQHARVDEEWSAVETMRHLIYAGDTWFRHSILNLDDAYSPIGLPFSYAPSEVAATVDASADPSFADVRAVRAERRAEFGDYLARLDADESSRTPGRRPLWVPDDAQLDVLHCVHVILNEEWEHHRFCVRDLERLNA